MDEVGDLFSRGLMETPVAKVIGPVIVSLELSLSVSPSICFAAAAIQSAAG
jgi:hypothetical protein